MDNSPDDVSPDLLNTTLSYDDSVAYENQIPAQPAVNEQSSKTSSLANRIGNTKVYLLSDTAASRGGKRKHMDEDPDEMEMEEEAEMDEDLPYRANALLLKGPPISHLPTEGLFAYAKHFDAHPMGLEWVDDNTCVFVYSNKTRARVARESLQKSSTEEPDADDFVTAKPIPVALWPPEERINTELGKGQGLQGVIRMRWALSRDIKKKGAKRESEFYRKHGQMAGKLQYGRTDNVLDRPPPRKRRGQTIVDEALSKSQLDDELDRFLVEDERNEDEVSEPAADRPPSPPSKMRSDYIASDGRTLLERTSTMRAHSDWVEFSDLVAPLPRRAGGRQNGADAEPTGRTTAKGRRERRERRRGRGNKDSEPPRKKTRQELDDELDAFLNERD